MEFFKSRIFWINLLVAVLLFAGSFAYIYKWLDSYTHHGQTITVPDLTGMTPARVKDFLGGRQLRFEVIDSVYSALKLKGTVVEQSPDAGSKVKENRTIYLTVNAMLPPQVKMPNLVDVSYRQAAAVLQTYGLKVGGLVYKPDMAKNAVLKQVYRGREIKPGAEIPKGAVIDLILGSGLGDTQVEVPELVNLTYEEALSLLKSASLNKGAVIADETVKDTASAVVWKQIPPPSKKNLLNQGESVDLFLTQSKK